MSRITFKWQVEVVTPVHIGVAQQKYLTEGIDFIIKHKKIHVLDQRKLIEKLGIDRYTQLVISGGLKNQISNDLKVLSIKTEDFAGFTRELRPTIKNTLSGKPYIPGTSIKGAIRSALVHQASKDVQNFSPRYLFGRIEEDIMKFIKISDVELESTKFYNSKIYNLKEDSQGFYSVWKKNLGGNEANSEAFDDINFTTGYECIIPSQKGILNIHFDFKRFEKNKQLNNVLIPRGLWDLFTESFEEKMSEILYSNGKEYCNKELQFFDSYVNADFTKVLKEDIEKVNDTLASNKASLRVGHGSGFHAMTGDWSCPDHLIDQIYKNDRGRTRGKRNGKNSAKSRKLLFYYSETGADPYFYPMGYITLSKI